ncbi:MAG: hypothetical protein ACI8QS_000917 [Planctomycetota bacterium]|jgi:hypothetical protein
MRKTLFPVFLFAGLVIGGIMLQHEAVKRRTALEGSLGGARLGISLETAAAFARQLHTLDADVVDVYTPQEESERPSLAAMAPLDGD